MKILLQVALVTILVASQVGAVSPPVSSGSTYGSPLETPTSVVPLAGEDIRASTVSVTLIKLNNTSNNTVKCTVVDKQATPRTIIPTVTLAACNSSGGCGGVVVAFGQYGTLAVGGVHWSCDTDTSVEGSVQFKQ